ncbi:RNA polymerase II degradation factor 1-like isoform X2 [Hyposmocoma kahamanoa]|uniref:RNA polymerase II degradation factor 1-like isoform X2 n=1 Tax=Hyposmocoma kahamanoa TaxID=1477025 RepID=UPI000E6D70F0|nr:RNA polymerase II degradation factor 1-like isoform X2 [Hyposmocoma kahamanoa]
MKFIIVLGVILAVVTARPSPSSRRRLSRLSLQLVETDDDDEIVNNEKYDHRHNAHHLTPSTATNRADRAGNEALRERLEQEERRENEQLRARLEREFESAKSEAESNAQVAAEAKNLRENTKQSSETQQTQNQKPEVQPEVNQVPEPQKSSEVSEPNEPKQTVKQFPVKATTPLRNSDLRTPDVNDYNQVPVHMPITVAAPANSQVQLAQPVQGSASIASLLQRLSNLATGPSKASPTPPPSNPTKYRNRGAVKVQYVPSSSSNPDARYLGSLHFRYIAPNELQQSQQVNHENKGDAKNLLLSSFNPRYFTALRNYLRSAAELQDLAQKAAQRSGPSWRNSQ